MIAIIGTSDQPCWLAEACKIRLPLLSIHFHFSQDQDSAYYVQMRSAVSNSIRPHKQLSEQNCVCPPCRPCYSPLGVKTCFHTRSQGSPCRVSRPPSPRPTPTCTRLWHSWPLSCATLKKPASGTWRAPKLFWYDSCSILLIDAFDDPSQSYAMF